MTTSLKTSEAVAASGALRASGVFANPEVVKASEAGAPTARQLCEFLADYSSWLMASGATCIRLEKNVGRIAAAYGMAVEMTVMPRHIHLAATREGEELTTFVATVRNQVIDYTVNTRLSRLSWAIADGKTGFREAEEQLKAIVAPRKGNPLMELILVALANASFCRLFGGDGMAMAIVGVATMAGYYLKQIMLRRKIDCRLVFLACSFVSAVTAASDTLFGFGTTPDIAIGSSVLYLVPGIPFLNSFSDFLYRRYLSAFVRFSDALVLTCCLSTGLCAGMLLMHIGMF